MTRGWRLAMAGALILMGLGVWLGEAGDTLLNARAVCLACLGIG